MYKSNCISYDGYHIYFAFKTYNKWLTISLTNTIYLSTNYLGLLYHMVSQDEKWVRVCIWYWYNVYNIFYTKTRSNPFSKMFVKYNIYNSLDILYRLPQSFNHNKVPRYSCYWLNFWGLLWYMGFTSVNFGIPNDSKYIKSLKIICC
jgi:hypothetical protein